MIISSINFYKEDFNLKHAIDEDLLSFSALSIGTFDKYSQIWFIDENNCVKYRAGVSSMKPDGEKWSRVCDTFKAASLSWSHSIANLILSINDEDGCIYMREGIDHKENPHGTVWRKLNLKYQQKLNSTKHNQTKSVNEMKQRLTRRQSSFDAKVKTNEQMFMDSDFDIFLDKPNPELFNQSLCPISSIKSSININVETFEPIDHSVKPNTVGTILDELKLQRYSA